MGAGARRAASPLAETPAGVPSLPVGRWAAAGACLLAEYIAVSVRFDSGDLTARIAWLHGIGDLGGVALVVLTAAVVLGGKPAADQVARLRVRVAALPSLWRWAPAHLASVVAFLVVTNAVFGGGLPTAAHPTALIAAWVLLVGAVTFTAVGAAIPARAAASLARLCAYPGLVGLLAGALAWSLGRASEILWPFLSHVTLEAAAAVLAPFAGSDLYKDVARQYLGVGNFVVVVAAGCSGVQGMGLIAALATVYVVRFRRTLRMPLALIVVPIGVAAAFAANVLRIAALVWIGGRVSPDIALGGFHSKTGWLLNCALTLALLALVRRSRALGRAAGAGAAVVVVEAEPERENPTVPYVMPLMVNLGLVMLTGAGVASFDRLGPLRILAVAVSLAWLLPRRRLRAVIEWRPALAPVLIGAAVLPVWLLLAGPTDADRASVGAGLAALSWQGRLGWLAARAFGLMVLAPVTEELAFRGFLLRRLYQVDFHLADYADAARRPWPLLGSAIAFGALHRSLVAGAIAGLAYGLAMIPRGRLADAVVAHTVTNVLLVGYVVATSSWQLLA
jgi:exosortase E/protease (VPEID-CTERM system)